MFSPPSDPHGSSGPVSGLPTNPVDPVSRGPRQPGQAGISGPEAASVAFSADPSDGIQDPPQHWWGIVRCLGPGLIIAGSVVGSGELIATTKTGAQAGISLLWLIILGCVIKVFVQVELGRYTLSHGESTLTALNRVPGPRLGVRWIIWYWILMMLASMGQLGGIAGGVGQALAISFPLTGDYAQVVSLPAVKECQRYLKIAKAADNGGSSAEKADSTGSLDDGIGPSDVPGQDAGTQNPGTSTQSTAVDDIDARFAAAFERTMAEAGPAAQERLRQVQAGLPVADPRTQDDAIWATVVAIATAFLLYWGRYRTIQNLSTVMVVAFTFITIGNVVSLQTIPQWAISLKEFWQGLSFGLPESRPGMNPLHTAMATFGIIGVGAAELIAYPYWCLEKGYARWCGPRSQDDAWAIRARGWMRVMQYDAFCSLVVYTLATLAFFLMGVAVLSREGRDPEDMRMVTTLASAYVPVFGEYARWLFLIGAFAVLYSTLLVASAGHVRTWIDAFGLVGLIPRDQPARQAVWLKRLSFVFPLLCLMFFLFYKNPTELVLLSGILQAVMLPMLAGSALYFRYRQTDARLRPSPAWDAALILSSMGMLAAGVWGAYSKLSEYL
jgi:Mn2+/Fe2+ NRAMP family transporter